MGTTMMSSPASARAAMPAWTGCARIGAGAGSMTSSSGTSAPFPGSICAAAVPPETHSRSNTTWGMHKELQLHVALSLSQVRFERNVGFQQRAVTRAGRRCRSAEAGPTEGQMEATQRGGTYMIARSGGADVCMHLVYESGTDYLNYFAISLVNERP